MAAARDKAQSEVHSPDTPPAIPADIKRTLIDALRVDREEYGDSAENRNAVLWLEGKLHAAT